MDQDLTHDLALLPRAAKSLSASHPAHPVGYNLAGVSIGWVLCLGITLEGGRINFPKFPKKPCEIVGIHVSTFIFHENQLFLIEKL